MTMTISGGCNNGEYKKNMDKEEALIIGFDPNIFAISSFRFTHIYMLMLACTISHLDGESPLH